MSDKYVMGIDFGTSGARVGIFDTKGNEVIFCDEPIELLTPRPGFAEQRAGDWWAALCKASKRAISETGIDPKDIAGIGTDTTACTLVFMDGHMQPLMNAIMWMDVRASAQASRAAETDHPVNKYTGFGNASAEWMPYKTLWVKENLPDIYEKTSHILACDDWLGYMLTGNIVKNLNDAAARWYYDSKNGGWQEDFYDMLGLEGVMEKIPREVKKLGEGLGGLTGEAAKALGLAEGIPVAVGGADAYVAMLALGAVREGRMAMVTGSSHLFMLLVKDGIHGKGMFGSYPDAVVDGLEMLEAGQTSTGSIINWFKNSLCGSLAHEAKSKGLSIYDILNAQAGKLPIGSDGLVCLDYFQGNRTPYVDGDARGLISGLTLAHTPAHIYRALVEGICYGSEIIFRNFRKNNVPLKELYACGGAVKSDFWMQAHSDVSGLPINIPRVMEAPVLGSAILGAVAGGVYPDIASASDSMVEIVKRIEPNKERHEEYRFYADSYAELYPLLKDWMHRVARHGRS